MGEVARRPSARYATAAASEPRLERRGLQDRQHHGDHDGIAALEHAFDELRIDVHALHHQRLAFLQSPFDDGFAGNRYQGGLSPITLGEQLVRIVPAPLVCRELSPREERGRMERRQELLRRHRAHDFSEHVRRLHANDLEPVRHRVCNGALSAARHAADQGDERSVALRERTPGQIAVGGLVPERFLDAIVGSVTELAGFDLFDLALNQFLEEIGSDVVGAL